MKRIAHNVCSSEGVLAPQPLPYGLHLIEEDDVQAAKIALRQDAQMSIALDEDDISAALATLRGPLLAQGPFVQAFEQEFAGVVGASHAVACSSGTAALHLALASLEVADGDVCIVPAITFLSTATAARFCNAEVVFADVDSITGLMTPASLSEALKRAGKRAKAVLPVHLAGRACDMDEIFAIARDAGLRVVEDACHALGTRVGGRPVGDGLLSDATTFSFHPVKTIACGEGGMVTTNNRDQAERMRRLRNHGVTREPSLMQDQALSFGTDGEPNPWSYEQLELGFNYRMTELEGALGRSQLGKLPRFVSRRAGLAARYDALLAPLEPLIQPVRNPIDQTVSLHIYVAQMDYDLLGMDRSTLVNRLGRAGIGAQVHYIPIYRQPYFVQRYGEMRLPGAELYYSRSLALPLFPAMATLDVDRVVLELIKIIGR
jgi:UDP-4-amino-4,6-dideoxy-N-acetyl-beta-L-altrosamine transaminase